MLTVALAAAIILASAPPAQPPQSQAGAPSRDRAPAGPSTGVIRGRVIAQDTGLPIAQATVTLTSRSIPRQAGETPLQATTDADGRYEFTALPAGEYRISARPGDFRASYLPQTFGHDGPPTPGRARPSRPLTLADGETREDVDFALWRAFAIEGRVVNEFGEPMAGVSVRPRDAETDRQISMDGPYQFMTDDRGRYRVYGLPPGSYLLCATPKPFRPRDDDAGERYVETCHPAATAGVDAQPVTIVASDVGGVDIRLHRSQAFKPPRDRDGPDRPDRNARVCRRESRTRRASGPGR